MKDPICGQAGVPGTLQITCFPTSPENALCCLFIFNFSLWKTGDLPCTDVSSDAWPSSSFLKYSLLRKYLRENIGTSNILNFSGSRACCPWVVRETSAHRSCQLFQALEESSMSLSKLSSGLSIEKGEGGPSLVFSAICRCSLTSEISGMTTSALEAGTGWTGRYLTTRHLTWQWNPQQGKTTLSLPGITGNFFLFGSWVSKFCPNYLGAIQLMVHFGICVCRERFVNAGFTVFYFITPEKLIMTSEHWLGSSFTW